MRSGQCEKTTYNNDANGRCDEGCWDEGCADAVMAYGGDLKVYGWRGE